MLNAVFPKIINANGFLQRAKVAKLYIDDLNFE